MKVVFGGFEVRAWCRFSVASRLGAGSVSVVVAGSSKTGRWSSWPAGHPQPGQPVNMRDVPVAHNNNSNNKIILVIILS